MSWQIDASVVWLGIAVLAVIVELATPSFGWIFATLAALVSALSAWLGMPGLVQVSVFAVVLVASLLLLRPRLLGKLGARGVPSRTEALVGKLGEVTSAIDPVQGNGRVLVDGEDWAARSAHAVAAGRRVRVLGANGIQLEVQELEVAASRDQTH